MTTNAVFLYNPAAGFYPLSEKRVKLTVEALYRCGIRAESVKTGAPEDVSSWLHLRSKDLLIIHGGDGTLHHVLAEAVKWKVPVGLLPAGTANVLARELNIPTDPERAFRVLLGGKLTRIHLPKANGRYFHLMAGIGFDGHVVSQVNREKKRRWGKLAYCFYALLGLLRYRFRLFRLRLDDEVCEATFAVIANARGYGGLFYLAPRADIHEESLDVCAFKSRNPVRFFYYFLGVLTGHHLRYPDVIYRKVRHVQVMFEEPLPGQMDGEPLASSPAEFSVSEEGLEVLVP